MNQTAMNSPSPELPELLASIRSHADLMKIPESELPRLAEEIRNTLIHSLPSPEATWAPTWAW